MSAAGFFMISFSLEPSMFGMPVNRSRIWMLCIPYWLIRDAHVEPAFVEQYAQKVLDSLVTNTVRSRDDYLLPPDHMACQEELQRCLEVSRKRSTREAKQSAKEETWSASHAALFAKHGQEWSKPSVPPPHIFRQFPHLNGLTERQFDTLALNHVKFPEADRRCIDLTQGAGRAHMQTQRYPIVTPDCELYLTDLGRCVVGQEALGMQSIHYGQRHHLLACYPSAFLKNLAGNAFNGHCDAALLIARHAVLAKLWVCTCASRLQASPLMGQSRDDFDDVLDLDV